MDTGGKSPKQGLTSAKDLPIELLQGRESPYHRLNELTNLTCSLIYGPWGRATDTGMVLIYARSYQSWFKG